MKEKLVFFFLINNKTKFDGKFSHKNPKLKQFIKKIADDRYEVGIHPSYDTYLSAGLLTEEIDKMGAVTGKQVTKSRQHYLRYRLPDTRENLISAGITDDYTCCPVTYIGFSNCIATSYPWFNLKTNQATQLMIHPAMVMDVSLKNYMSIDPELAYNRISGIINQVKKVRGHFILIWHNSNLSRVDGWDRWKDLFFIINDDLQRNSK